jgi:tetratricopeptide (TPR) repeat protein
MLLVVGFDVVYERLTTLRNTQAFEDRWEMTAATLRAWAQFPLFGSGLGTHEYVFPMFDRSVTPAIATHADNDYAQLLEETGVAGAVLVAAFLVGIVSLIVRLAQRRRSSSSVAAYGLAFGLIAVAIHSASDFGQRVPAILCLTAALCGLVIALHRQEKRRRRTSRRSRVKTAFSARRITRGVAVASLIGAAGVWSWALYDAYEGYLGEQWWWAALEMQSRISENPELATDEDYGDLITAAAGAFDSEPGNVKYGYWLNMYRWQSLSRVVDSETGEIMLHRDVLPFVARIADELAAVRRICPTYGPPYSLEGQLRLFVLKDERGAGLIRKGVRLAAYDPPTCLVAGELAAHDGDLNEAKRLLTRAVELQPEYFREVIGIFLQELKRLDLARTLAGNDYGRLMQLAQACADDPAHARMTNEIRSAAIDVLRWRAAQPNAAPWELAELAGIDFREQSLDSAIRLYRRAVNLDYGNIAWRLELARALDAAQQYQDAFDEVQVCLRLRPQYPPAQELEAALIEKLEGIDQASNPIGDGR